MKDRKRYFLKDAVVLMIVSAMVLSAIPAVTAIDTEHNEGGLPIFSSLAPPRIINPNEGQCYIPPQKIGGTFDNGGFGYTTFQYHDGTMENSLGLTAGGEITMTIELTSAELAAYQGFDVVDLVASVGSDGSPATITGYEVWVTTTLPSDPYSLPTGFPGIVGSGGGLTGQWVTFDITDVAVPASGSLFIGFNFVHAAGQYPLGFDQTTTVPSPQGNYLTYSGYGTWTNLNTIGYPGVWGITVGFEEGGGPGPVPGECLPDQCDFELVSINNIYGGVINSLPQIINITIRNNGEVGIPELKLLADVYEKVCGPTSTICEQQVYSTCCWEDEIGDEWTIIDDGDGDTFVLQADEWLTDGQAWRNTLGKYRTAGFSDDTYLGLSPAAVGFDELIYHCEGNDISGAACATFTFSHWCEGEYFVDCDGYTVPVDYGTLSYRMDGGNWTELPWSDFLAYDTEGEWQDVTIKFINTAIYEDGGYYEVCDDCEPAEGDIVIDGPFPDVANLEIKWTWHKDPCLQFKGWFIDNVKLTRTEMYELVLVHQTHDIIELPPCVGEPENIYYEFPLGFDPEPDTWYMICILGQVFDCPDCCEQIFDNNEMCIQFFVTDITDVACVGNEVLDPQDFWHVGDSICVNATVENLGTITVDNVPVELKVGKEIMDRTFDNCEDNPEDNWAFYYFTGGDPTNHFRWTQGDPSISDIGDGRSILPGEESLICADEGFLWPYLPLGAANAMSPGGPVQMFDYGSATLSFYAKWSIAAVPGDFSGWGFMAWPATGPDSAYVWFIGGATNGFNNDWQYYEYDLQEIAELFEYTEDGETIIPEIEWMIGCFAPELGGSIPAANPIPWSGLMIDNINYELTTCGTMTVVDTQYTGALVPGAQQTLQLCWNDAEFCNWCLVKDVNQPGDVDTTNDQCWDFGIKVRETYPLEDWSSIDLTGGDDCLWTTCKRGDCGCDGYCAWAGIIEETSGHYIPDMDDSLISPWIPMDVTDYPLGVALEITTWWNFCFDSGDFGEIYIRNNSANEWIKLAKLTGASDGFQVLQYYIEPWMFTDKIQIRLRMVSDSDDCVCDGWYVCQVDLKEVISLFSGTPGAWDIQLAFDVTGASGAAGNAGAEFDGTYLYTTRWASNLIHRYDTTGTMVEQFSISGVSGLRDLAFDGTYMYGGAGSTTVYEMDFTAKTLIATHSVPGAGVRAIAYNPDDNVFYVSNWGDPVQIIDATTWAQVGTFNLGVATSTYGFAYDNDAGAKSLYVYDQTAGYGTGNIYKWDLVAGSMIGIVHNTASDFPDANALAGGLWTGPGFVSGTTSIGALQQGTPDMYIIYELRTGGGGGGLINETGPAFYSEQWLDGLIAPWICEPTSAGDYWNTDDQIITNYPLYGKGLNDVMYGKLDFTDPELTYVEFVFETEWDIEDGVELFIEISPDWDGSEDMQDATWIPFWYEAGASAQSLIPSSELIPDDRFVLNEYLGEEIWIRFRFVTPGEGANKISDGFWHLANKQIVYKTEKIEKVDLQPPITNAYFDSVTAKVTLVAIDQPVDGYNCGVKATYYRIDSGDFKMYSGPVQIAEGSHKFDFYSEDNCGNKEATKSKTYIVDTTPPTVTLTSPEEGALYFFGSKIMNRILSDTTLCIGKVPVAATASDTGAGVYKVQFEFTTGSKTWTAWDDASPYESMFNEMVFGELTIKADAVDKVGLVSAPDTMTIKVYSIGLF